MERAGEKTQRDEMRCICDAMHVHAMPCMCMLTSSCNALSFAALTCSILALLAWLANVALCSVSAASFSASSLNLSASLCLLLSSSIFSKACVCWIEGEGGSE